MPFARRTLLAAAALLALAGPARAETAFDQAAFDAAQAAGKSIVVEVTAPWCPTCRAQKPVIAELLQDPAFAGLQLFVVDFDSQKDVLQALRVQAQSTLVAFKGTAEKARSTGDTDPAKIRALFEQAL